MPTLIVGKTPAADPLPKIPDWIFKGIIVLMLSTVVHLTFAGRLFQPLFEAAKAAHWSKLVVRPSLLWGMMGMVLLAFRTIAWFRYRPFPSFGMADSPSLTVIIPAYNEGPMVRKSIDSVAAALYPRDRLEIFVVDDGSRDDTWLHIQAAAKNYPGLVAPLRFPENRGKRAALEAGFRRARGEIVVTIDSDSVIDRETLLAVTGPFRDPKVGAVAGKVVVYNRSQGVIPRMLQVRYVLSFDFLRAVQSSYGTVYCCPGALAGYRKSAVSEVLDPWMSQTFLGSRCTYGEDRALTNFILDRGYNTVYQRSAVVRTIVPWTYRKLCKMYLRWDRSYVREEIRFVRILWKRPPMALAMALFDKFVTNLRYPIGYTSLVLLGILSVHDAMTGVRFLFAMGIMSFLNMFYYLQREPSWDFLYGIFYSYFSFFALIWIFPYAALTVRSKAWMTR
ncbi:MAG TPA: glycosyltransferase family 2 protein [Thermodesulfobacteriota bacterium]|nr:glycosyltransferase family 2 protein [Thermodesulfobacteriota bacterium]